MDEIQQFPQHTCILYHTLLYHFLNHGYFVVRHLIWWMTFVGSAGIRLDDFEKAGFFPIHLMDYPPNHFADSPGYLSWTERGSFILFVRLRRIPSNIILRQHVCHWIGTIHKIHIWHHIHNKFSYCCNIQVDPQLTPPINIMELTVPQKLHCTLNALCCYHLCLWHKYKTQNRSIMTTNTLLC